MKIEVHTDGVIITSKQKALMERKILKLKKYISDEPVMVDLVLRDESSPEKGGIDQKVEINATFGKEKIFISEIDDRTMRAFAIALKRFERQLSRFHEKRISKTQHGGGGRFEKLWGVIKRKR